jgi:hypothetical protein
MPVNYGKFAKKDLEPEVVTELEKLDKYLRDDVGRKHADIWLFTEEEEGDAPHRTFQSRAGLLSLCGVSTGHPKYGDRAVQRIRKKLAKAYPDMEQPTDRSPLETLYDKIEDSE